MSSKGQVIRAKIFQISGNILFLRIGSFRIVCQKKLIFLQLFRRATRYCATRAIYELEYLQKLKMNTRSVFFCCSVWLFYTFWPKMNKIYILLPKIFSKTLFSERFSWIFRLDFSRKIWLRQFVPIIVLKLHAKLTSFWENSGQTNGRTNERTGVNL